MKCLKKGVFLFHIFITVVIRFVVYLDHDWGEIIVYLVIVCVKSIFRGQI
jgi:hypothetical protein